MVMNGSRISSCLIHLTETLAWTTHKDENDTDQVTYTHLISDHAV